MIVESGIGTKLLSRTGIAALVMALAALAACSSKDTPKTAGETFATEKATSTTEFVGVRPDAYVESGDYVSGRHIAKLTAFDEGSVSFDVVQFLTGDAAKQAIKEDTGSDEPPDNDYYIRNQNPLVRTLPVAQEVAIRVNNAGGYPPSEPNTGHEVNESTFTSYMKAGKAQDGYFWLTIKDGKVTAIEEQYVP